MCQPLSLLLLHVTSASQAFEWPLSTGQIVLGWYCVGVLASYAGCIAVLSLFIGRSSVSTDAMKPDLWPHTRGGLHLNRSHDYSQWTPSFWSTLLHLFSECLTSPVSGDARWNLKSASDVEDWCLLQGAVQLLGNGKHHLDFYFVLPAFHEEVLGFVNTANFISLFPPLLASMCWGNLMKYLWPPLWLSVSTFVSFLPFKVWILFGMPIFFFVLIFVAISNSEEKRVFFTTESTSPLLKAAQNVKISHIYSTQLLQQTLFGSNGAFVAHAIHSLLKPGEKRQRERWRQIEEGEDEAMWLKTT